MAIATEAHAGTVEHNGINVIHDAERHGTPRQLLWPWFAANVSVLGLSYGSYVLGFGISLGQAVAAAVIGVLASFLLCGVIALAGKRGSAPTMVLSRAAFGIDGNRLPAAISWLLCVGWETVLTALAAEATATVFHRLGGGGGTTTKAVAFAVVVALIVGGGVLGFEAVMRMQTVITVVTAVLTVVYIVLVAGHIHWHTVSHLHSGSTKAVVGATILMMTGFGLGWVNCAADYSRYLPRRASGAGTVWWTTIGASLAPVVLVVVGILLTGSSSALNTAISNDPVGALTTILPTWYLVPFAIVAVLGLVGGAVLDIYSSGLTLLSVGLPAPRWAAALVDGAIMVAGTVYLVFIANPHDLYQFLEGFLITLGVPIAAWAGVMVADVLLRRRDYDEGDLYRPRGRYGVARWWSILLVVGGSAVGWGLVVSTTQPPSALFTWQGYLLGPFGLGGKGGSWASANLGVIVALGIGLVGWLLGGWPSVRRQEQAAPVGERALQARR